MTLDDLFLMPQAEAIIKLFSPETLTEFLDDVKRFDTICARDMVEAQGVDRRDGLLAAAVLLESFAERYCETFQKIKKINRQYASAA